MGEKIKIPDSELEFSFARSGGPGGQNVNKVNTKATLRWSVVSSPSISDEVRSRFLSSYSSRISSQGELLISSQRFREQTKNMEDCLDKLRSMLLLVEKAPRKRKPTRPGRAVIEKRLDTKRQQAEKKSQRRAPEF